MRGCFGAWISVIARAAPLPSHYPLPPQGRVERGNLELGPVRSRVAGFTLAEMLVAFTVAVLLLGAVYRVFSAGLRAEGSAEAYAKAVLIAQSSLDTLWLGPVAEGDVSDSVGAYARHVSVKRRSDLVRDDQRRPLAAYEMGVDVLWRDGVRQRQVSLSAIRLGPP
ncbi:MAG TPA: prepilin-type N-terminal cleavage/methylation domain-containing protein [Stellaceae bacterium]|nr:prepilin-type N-terminal cleavage/methylation domain-containing protein [Stellaceae bacterium]